MSEFYRTGMGTQFFMTTVPRIAAALERIAAALESAPKGQIHSNEATSACPEKAYVLVEVRDGVAEISATKGNVETVIIDWDNIEAGESVGEDILNHPVFGPWIAERS